MPSSTRRRRFEFEAFLAARLLYGRMCFATKSIPNPDVREFTVYQVATGKEPKQVTNDELLYYVPRSDANFDMIDR